EEQLGPERGLGRHGGNTQPPVGSRKRRLDVERGGGENPAARPVTAYRRQLLAGRRAFRGRDTSRVSRLVDEAGARHLRATGQVVVRHRREIGRASCREREEILGGGGA